MAKAKTRKQQRQRARYLRNKKRDGGMLDTDEVAELAAWEASKAAQPDDEPDEDDKAPTPIVEEAKPVEPAIFEPAIPPTPFPPAPPLAKPPRVSPAFEVVEAKGGDWRDKWRAKAQGAGREAAVTTVADQAIAILKSMTDACKAIGIDPILDPESLRPSAVLTFDNLLPERFKLTHEMQFFAGSAMIIGQRFAHRKKIAEHVKLATERAKHDEFRRKQHLSSVSMPTPTPTPPEAPPAVPTPAPEVAPSAPVESAPAPTNGTRDLDRDPGKVW